MMGGRYLRRTYKRQCSGRLRLAVACRIVLRAHDCKQN